MNRQPKIYIFCAGGNVQGVRVSNLPSEVEVEIIDKDDLGQDDYNERCAEIERVSRGIY